jgi:hypothetical protein
MLANTSKNGEENEMNDDENSNDASLFLFSLLA